MLIPILALLIESLFILPFALIAILLSCMKNGLNDFNHFSNPEFSHYLLMLAGPMTVIPLISICAWSRIELIGLGPAGMIFYITPTLQFLLGLFLL
jgi:chloramphenicol-sensitive protein RarD